MRIVALIIISFISACSYTPKAPEYTRNYPYAKDGANVSDNFDLAKVKPVTPKFEPKSKYGNPESYVVFGKKYTVLPSARNYREKGLASWYGKKFHGQRTSSGESYDMYAMSAAHKSLPLPTYVKVTNLKNHLSEIVRINDRGPFHQGRIIDLSYSAAAKLDFLTTGTAPVIVEAIDVDKYVNTIKKEKELVKEINKAVEKDSLKNWYVQAASFTNIINAQNMQRKLIKLLSRRVSIRFFKKNKRLYKRVIIGPFVKRQQAQLILDKIKPSLAPEAKIIDSVFKS